jgi:transposase
VWASFNLSITLIESMKAKSTVPSRRAVKAIRPANQLPVVHRHAAGIDVGATEHSVCVAKDAVPAGESPVRQYKAFTGDLDQMVEWLQACGVQTVAMESTGVYWIPLYQKLERAGLEVVLVNARHLKRVPGRKSDILDCQWLQQMHSYGLLSGSFRPSDDICVLRTYLRHRSNLVAGCGVQVQHMQRALDQMNIHLHHVVSDLDGETGLAILEAILAGERDPKELVKLRDARCHKSTVEEMEGALKGDWREEHLFVLKQSLAGYRALQAQIVECDTAMEKVLERVAVNPAAVPEAERPRNPVAAPEVRAQPKRKKRTRGNTPRQDLTAQLQRICGVDLTRIVGFNVLSVLIIISEIGVDMSRWPNAKAFCAWLGLCPGNKISGGKVLSSRTARVVNRVAILLRTLAPTLGRTDTWLGAFHRRMKARMGPAAANTATARKLATILYHLLRYREEYIDVDRVVYEEKFRRYRVSRLRKQAAELGYEMVQLKEAA